MKEVLCYKSNSGKLFETKDEAIFEDRMAEFDEKIGSIIAVLHPDVKCGSMEWWDIRWALWYGKAEMYELIKDIDFDGIGEGKVSHIIKLKNAQCAFDSVELMLSSNSTITAAQEGIIGIIWEHRWQILYIKSVFKAMQIVENNIVELASALSEFFDRD